MGKPPLGLKQPKERFTAMEKRFNKFMHRDVGRCCITDRPDIEIAHTGGLAHGKGAARKAWLSTCLPLAKPLHVIEERNHEEFWARVGFPDKDRFHWSVRLWDIFQKGDDYRAVNAWLADMQARANRAEIYDMLRNGK